MQKKSSNKLIKDEMPDAVVLALANTLTPSIGTRSGKILTDVRMNENLWCWYADGAGVDSAVTEGKVQARASCAGLGQADMGRGNGDGPWRGHPAAGTMTSLQAATLGPSSGVVADLWVPGGLGVALPCASAKHSCLLPEVFDVCSSVSRWLSRRERAIIKEVNETAFTLNFLEMVFTVGSESCEKWRTPYCPQTWHHLYFTVSTL